MSKHIKTISAQKLQKTLKTGGCGECQTSLPIRLQNQLHGWQPSMQALIPSRDLPVARVFLFQMQLRSLEGCRGDLFYSQRLGQNMTIR